MERFGASFLIAGVITFLLGFVLQGVLPIATLRNIPVQSLEEISRVILPDFEQLAHDYPAEFQRAFGEVSHKTFQAALEEGKAIYIAEACWHCHSQFVRPVSREDLRFGPVSTPDEYMNRMNLPHLFGTRRIGPDLIRQAGKHSNDWHVAHFYEPRDTSPYSVMPAYRWYFDADGRPKREVLSLTTYVQWLGSWAQEAPETIYNADLYRTEKQP
jgi:cbb3-type cytochrome oxidase cytochrome c subunit